MSNNNPYTAVVSAIPVAGELHLSSDETVKDAWNVVLNVGKNAGISINNVFLIFALGPEIKDPQTGESLGHYEHVRGRAKVTHLQEKMCTVRSQRTTSKLVTRNALIPLGTSEGEYREVPAPFVEVRVGDFARLIS